MMSFYLCIILNTIPLQTDVWLTTALHELDQLTIWSLFFLSTIITGTKTSYILLIISDDADEIVVTVVVVGAL